MDKNIEELTLLLMYLTSWDEEGYMVAENDMIKQTKLKNAWKGYSFDAINNLVDNGYLYSNNYKNKSITLTLKGEELAQKLIEKYIK